MNFGSRASDLSFQRRRSLQSGYNFPSPDKQRPNNLDALDHYVNQRTSCHPTLRPEEHLEHHAQNPEGNLTGSLLIHHDPTDCVCNDCKCGEHRCKLKVVKPEMNIKSVYQQDFHRVNSFGDSLKVNRPVMRQQSSNLGKGSMYTKDFSPPRDSRMEKHGAPENNLNPKVGEVAPTSLYKAHYPGFVGERLPNLPCNNSQFALGMSFNAVSSYQKNYGEKHIDMIVKPEAPLKVNKPFLGESTYKKAYMNRQEVELNKQFVSKSPEAIHQTYPLQLGSTYQGAFMSPAVNAPCPAKTSLLKKMSSGRALDVSGAESPQ